MITDCSPFNRQNVLVSLADPFLIIGHRGAAGLVAENTLPSFQRAIDCGVGAVELDVYAVEGELLVIHDDTLERTTDGSGNVIDQPLATLRRLDAGGGWPIPLLAEVVAILPHAIGINIELKGPDTAAPVAEFLSRQPLAEVLVSSFDHAELGRFRDLAPTVPVAPLFSRWNDDAWQIAASMHAWSINLSRRIATPERLARARAAGLRALVYTVNNLAEARKLIGLGATGIFTDYPDRITAAALQTAPAEAQGQP
jgi:glycerophosphoryl diester phosphodiesterase